MKLITPELEARFAEVGDQSDIENPIIIAKFFDPVGSGTWYATEYDKETKICHGYVTGFANDEWGSFSIDELESIKRPLGLRIERDLYCKEQTFDELFPKKNKDRLSELPKNKEEQERER
ncbi:DUF2958 domain-containing protein [Aquimarina hainanensis]|uniref:DUF2958 domain-containing protein n=1 Tax=Aquimarina hainanensis TaxID=1578017 RepID=A0ABW5N8U2_9FLAO